MIRTSPRAPARPRAAVLLAVLLAGALAWAPETHARREKGERVPVSGIVTDAEGQPLADVRVVLEASRAVFSLREFRAVLRDTTRVAAVTDAQGQFRLEWPWDSFYNHFELVAGVPVRSGRGERFQELARSDVTRRVGGRGPVVATLLVENAEFLRTLRSFLAALDSDDEQRVYRDAGMPGRVENQGGEARWWYFEQGRMYRFDRGRLVEVKTFAPVDRL
ncbi:MAG TPA: carboxypeptidase-like regulatory domain-containing protein [Thermoanaerobaculia bacterium]|nr:carboxypeptidase-like regulatory domain-containing protein [Thermoanaerobaculia bacterium]